MDWLAPFKADVERRLIAARGDDDAAQEALKVAHCRCTATATIRNNLARLRDSIARLEQSADEAEVPL